MCFSVNVNLIKEELEGRYGATLIDMDKYRPSYYYHAFALPVMPVVCSEDPSLIKMHTWGLIPSTVRSWSEAERIRMNTFNARAEGIDRKASYSSSFKTRRCIVPVKGFFEWQHSAGHKIPWYIYAASESIISLAGLYDKWVESSTGQEYNTFTIITTDANELLARIHNSAKRMPVVLDRDSEKTWLESSDPSDLVNCLRALPSEYFKAHTISPLVSSKTAGKNTPDVIRPYGYDIQATLF